MKDLIEYYYNLVIDKLFIEDDKYHFILNNHDFYFVYFSRTKEDLEDILFVSNEQIVITLKNYLKLYDLRYEKGMTQTEIAEELNLSQSEVSKRLFKLMDKVKQAFN